MTERDVNRFNRIERIAFIYELKRNEIQFDRNKFKVVEAILKDRNPSKSDVLKCLKEKAMLTEHNLNNLPEYIHITSRLSIILKGKKYIAIHRVSALQFSSTIQIFNNKLESLTKLQIKESENALFFISAKIKINEKQKEAKRNNIVTNRIREHPYERYHLSVTFI